MGEDPGQIRDEIERTRAQMGDTVEAIGYKADVPARAKEKVSETEGAHVGLKAKVDRRPRPDADERQSSGARRAAGVAQENPLGLAIGAVAVGFLAGMLSRPRRVEDEKLGPMADDVKEKAQGDRPGGPRARQAGRPGRRRERRRRPSRRAASTTARS